MILNRWFLLLFILMLSCMLVTSTSFVVMADDDFQEKHDQHDKHDKDEEEGPFEEVAKLAGKLAVAVGALSLAWYLMKRKLKSTNPKVRKLAKYFFNWHTWAGWIAFAIILAHGVYFVLTEFGEDDTITGIIAFAFMVSLIIVGLFLQAKRSKTKRMTHFVLAIVWCVATVIHAEDAIPLLLVVLGGSFALVWLLEKRGNEGG